MSEFKEYFKKARIRKDLQQKDLAEKLGVVPAYISRIEKGFSLPSDELLVKICDILEMNFESAVMQVQFEKTDLAATACVFERAKVALLSQKANLSLNGLLLAAKELADKEGNTSASSLLEVILINFVKN